MSQIHTEYCQEIGSYLVRFPSQISLNALKVWGSEFALQLQERPAPAGLLLDTNTHEFESVDCLKWLKGFLTERAVLRSGISRVAFVQPGQYRMPEVVTESEAYFLTVKEAYEWLSPK
jgi:hypothetical protein